MQFVSRRPALAAAAMRQRTVRPASVVGRGELLGATPAPAPRPPGRSAGRCRGRCRRPAQASLAKQYRYPPALPAGSAALPDRRRARARRRSARRWRSRADQVEPRPVADRAGSTRASASVVAGSACSDQMSSARSIEARAACRPCSLDLEVAVLGAASGSQRIVPVEPLALGGELVLHSRLEKEAGIVPRIARDDLAR